MTDVVVAVVSGLSMGGVYALIGLGFVLAFRATSTFNFAHAELMVLPAFVAGGWISSGVATAVAALLALVLVALVGAAFYWTVLQRTVGLPHWMGFVASLGLAAVLQGVMTLWFGVKTYAIDLPGVPDGAWDVLGARVSAASVVLAAASFGLGIALVLLLRFTRIGITIRAAGQDAALASQGGINVGLVFLASWAGAAALAGLAGIVYTSQNIVSHEAAIIAWAAIPAAMLGGLDSIGGVLAGSAVVGLLHGFTAMYVGGAEVDVVVFSLLLVLLLVRPTGMFGTKAVTRV